MIDFFLKQKRAKPFDVREAEICIPSKIVINNTPAVKPLVNTPLVRPVMSTPSVKPIVNTPSIKPLVSSPSIKPVVSTPAVKPVVSTPAVKPVVSSPRTETVKTTADSSTAAKTADASVPTAVKADSSTADTSIVTPVEKKNEVKPGIRFDRKKRIIFIGQLMFVLVMITIHMLVFWAKTFVVIKWRINLNEYQRN